MSTSAWTSGSGRGVDVVRSESVQYTAAQAAVEDAKGDAASFEDTSSELVERIERLCSSLTAEQAASPDSSRAGAEVVGVLTAAKEHICRASQLSSRLQGALDKLLRIVQQLVAENCTLKDELQQVNSKLQQVEDEQQQQKQAVLLGQLVYTVNTAVREAVFQGLPSGRAAAGRRRVPFYSLPDVLQKKREGDLSQEQVGILSALEQLLERETGLKVGDLAVCMRELRGGRATAAHSTAEERGAITPQQLRGWAKAAGVQDEDFEAVLAAALIFSEQGRPLVLATNLSNRLSSMEI